ncbi:MAG: uroporphyrinogen decarboxylase family protein [Candidatus Bipolaricaulota bacterium]
MAVQLFQTQPDIQQFIAVLTGEKAPRRVHFAELFLDDEIMQTVIEKYIGASWVDRPLVSPGSSGSPIQVKDNGDAWRAYISNTISCLHQLGYDYVWTGGWHELLFQGKWRVGTDPTKASTKRYWREQSEGMIASWEDFDQYPWPDVNRVSLEMYDFASQTLPEGMGMFACLGTGILETVMHSVVGFEPLCHMLYKHPELVRAIFDRVGETLYALYRRLVGLPNLYGFFQGDDMGYQKGTLISPKHLREYVLPWHKRIAALAHQNGLLYMLHSCGNIEAIMPELIDELRIDAKHSFQDNIMPVWQFKAKYGSRIGVLGGIDVDKLCRLSIEELRAYVRDTLDSCMPGGRYALGTGNSVAGYVPLENYFAMLEEGTKWEK